MTLSLVSWHSGPYDGDEVTGTDVAVDLVRGELVITPEHAREPVRVPIGEISYVDINGPVEVIDHETEAPG